MSREVIHTGIIPALGGLTSEFPWDPTEGLVFKPPLWKKNIIDFLSAQTSLNSHQDWHCCWGIYVISLTLMLVYTYCSFPCTRISNEYIYTRCRKWWWTQACMNMMIIKFLCYIWYDSADDVISITLSTKWKKLMHNMMNKAVGTPPYCNGRVTQDESFWS